MTRQISESVRIDLSGGGVLKSKTEYSRCRLPRLTVDMDEWRSKKKEEKKILEPIPELGMEWLNEEWDGEIKEEKRKPEDTANIKQKRRKLEPLVGWGEKLDNPAPSIRTWLFQDSSQEEEEETDWRLKVPSPQQTPSQKLKQMEWDFGQRFREAIP